MLSLSTYSNGISGWMISPLPASSGKSDSSKLSNISIDELQKNIKFEEDVK